MAKENNISKLTFEEAYEKLQQIVAKLQQEGTTLEETVSLYKEGKLLSDRCEELLANAKMELEKIPFDSTNN